MTPASSNIDENSESLSKEKTYEAPVLPIAILVYILLSGFIMYYDFSVFSNWSDAAKRLGILEIYRTTELLGYAYRVVYPPLAPLLFIASYGLVRETIAAIAMVFGNIGSLAIKQLTTVFIERLLLKAPLVFSALGLWKLMTRSFGREVSVLILLGPPVLAVITVYNFDLYMVLAATASLILLYYGRTGSSAALLAIATLFKQAAIVLLPLALLFTYRAQGYRESLRYLGTYIATASIILAPFMAGSGISLFKWIAGFHETRPPQGPTIPAAFYTLAGYNECFLVEASSTASFMLMAFLIGYSLYRYSTSKTKSLETIIAAAAMIMVAILASSKVVNPVYTLWAYPFVAAVAARRKNYRLLAAYTAASLIVYTWFLIPYSTALITGSPVYLYEEERWLSYNELTSMIMGSLGPYKPFLDLLLLIAKSSNALWGAASILYLNWELVTLVLGLVYTGLMILTYYELSKTL